ncbi:hypothetical protein DMI62_13680 [Escherichia coli]|nr:hypothetical protein [Escherichia coli]
MPHGMKLDACILLLLMEKYGCQLLKVVLPEVDRLDYLLSSGGDIIFAVMMENLGQKMQY